MAKKIFVVCFYKWVYAPYECTKKQCKLKFSLYVFMNNNFKKIKRKIIFSHSKRYKNKFCKYKYINFYKVNFICLLIK